MNFKAIISLSQISTSVCCLPMSVKMNPCNAKTNLALTTVFVGMDCTGLTTNAKVSAMYAQ